MRFLLSFTIKYDRGNKMWYVIQVNTGHESEIVEQCKSRVVTEGEEVFVMLGERKKRIKGEWVLHQYHLFPGYIFIDTDRIEDFFIRLKDIPSMTKVLRVGEEWIPIYREEESYLKMLGGDEHIAKFSEGYLEGEKLIITEGALEGYEGKVKRLLRHQRLVIIEVHLMGQTVEVKLGLEVVKRI